MTVNTAVLSVLTKPLAPWILDEECQSGGFGGLLLLRPFINLSSCAQTSNRFQWARKTEGGFPIDLRLAAQFSVSLSPS